MIYTEAEAKEKTCCQQADQSDTCIGSGCMAWRWYGSNGPFRMLHDGDYLMGNGEVTDAKNVTAIHGYCGLAGTPGGAA